MMANGSDALPPFVTRLTPAINPAAPTKSRGGTSMTWSSPMQRPCPAMSAAPADLSMPVIYCYCCGGHFRFHYQIALGVPLPVVGAWLGG